MDTTKHTPCTRQIIHTVHDKTYTLYTTNHTHCTRKNIHPVHDKSYTLYTTNHTHCTRQNIHPVHDKSYTLYTTKHTPCTRLSTITPFKFLHLAHQFGLPSPDILQGISLVLVRYDGAVRGVGLVGGCGGGGWGGNISEQSDSCCTHSYISFFRLAGFAHFLCCQSTRPREC